jgi:Flp pilus assembly protein TadG
MTGILSSFRDRRGASALEFGAVGAVLAGLLLGVWDVGNAVQQQIRLTEALRAAAEYARSFPTDSTGISDAVTRALPSGWTNVTVSVCAAPTCTPQGFISLSASRPFSAALIRSITSISASYVIRYQ